VHEAWRADRGAQAIARLVLATVEADAHQFGEMLRADGSPLRRTDSNRRRQHAAILDNNGIVEQVPVWQGDACRGAHEGERTFRDGG